MSAPWGHTWPGCHCSQSPRAGPTAAQGAAVSSQLCDHGLKATESSLSLSFISLTPRLFLSCKPTWFYPHRTGLSLPHLTSAFFLLNTDPPCSGQLFWSPVLYSIPTTPISSSFSYLLPALISLPLYALLSFCSFLSISFYSFQF